MKTRDLKPCFIREAYYTDSDGRRRYNGMLRRGIASEFIAHLSELRKRSENRLVVLYLRESTTGQMKNGNLRESEEWALAQIRRLGYTIVGKPYCEVAHSSIDAENRIAFYEAIEAARTSGAILVTPSRDRFLRHQYFQKTNDTEQPTVSEYRRLRFLTKGVQLATIVHPDKCARGSQSKRGQEAKGNRGGRPMALTKRPGWQKCRRDAYSIWAEAWRDEGWSLRWISTRLGKSPLGYPAPTPKTLWNWFYKPGTSV